MHLDFWSFQTRNLIIESTIVAAPNEGGGFGFFQAKKKIASVKVVQLIHTVYLISRLFSSVRVEQQQEPLLRWHPLRQQHHAGPQSTNMWWVRYMTDLKDKNRRGGKTSAAFVMTQNGKFYFSQKNRRRKKAILKFQGPLFELCRSQKISIFSHRSIDDDIIVPGPECAINFWRDLSFHSIEHFEIWKYVINAFEWMWLDKKSRQSSFKSRFKLMKITEIQGFWKK